MLLAVVSVLSVLWWSSFGRWGLAFSLPWILAYFYFIWICPAHQLSVGIRRVEKVSISTFKTACQ